MTKPLLHVLLIDDEPAQAWLVKEYLQPHRDRISDLDCVESLAEGLERLQQGDIQVLLLDLSLPDSLGTETLAKVRARFPNLPVVVLTSLEDEELGSQLMQLGAQDYLVKGQINGLMLLRSLRYAVERQQSQVEREKLIGQLQQALAQVKTLSGLVPICCRCKKIRDDKGYWNELEIFLASHSDAQFSHGYCPNCYEDAIKEVESLRPGPG
jgi:DNA-binding response OmpR family regulator